MPGKRLGQADSSLQRANRGGLSDFRSMLCLAPFNASKRANDITPHLEGLVLRLVWSHIFFFTPSADLGAQLEAGKQVQCS